MTAGLFCSPQLTHTPLAQGCAACLCIWCCAKVLMVHTPETFAGTGAKHYAGLVMAAFTAEEFWCQLKPVTGLSLGSLPPPEGTKQAVCISQKLICSRTSWYGQGFLETKW